MIKPTQAEQMCKNPCKTMTNKVSLVAENDGIGKNQTLVILNFKKTARVEKSIVAYTWFNFIIDVGSSLGLWLGLSALGVTDVAIKGFQLAKKWLKIE